MTRLSDALAHLVKGIVDHPDDVAVASAGSSRGEVLEVRVHPDDLGRVIGRGGRTAKALRTVVGALADGERVRVDVVDSGPGINDADRERIFQPFVSQDADGTGLGLPIARELMRRWGGDVTLANREGGGAVATISFDRA